MTPAKMSCLSIVDRRPALNALIEKMNEDVRVFCKKTEDGEDLSFSYSFFVREVARRLIPARDCRGHVFLRNKQPGPNDRREDLFAWDCVTEVLWPRAYRFFSGDGDGGLALEQQDELEALLLRVARFLLEKELSPIVSRLFLRI
jgi:hypothetical protein